MNHPALLLGRPLSEWPDRRLVRDLLDHFSRTTVMDEIPRGEEDHIGEGVFLRRCPSCDDFTLTAGASIPTTDYTKHLMRHSR